MSGKYALIIGNTEYSDPNLAQLAAPGKDAEDLGAVFRAPEFGAFDNVVTLINQESAPAREAIEDFFSNRSRDDLLVFYFSGHGVKDEEGHLYLAVKNTKRHKLDSTGIESAFIKRMMGKSYSKRQVLILDCCNSGAFSQGTKAATGGSIGTQEAFNTGSGQVILTASDSTQFAWEGNKVIGNTDNSLFTHYLIEGLRGEADHDGDGQITVDELYDYVYEQVLLKTPKQTPSKFSNKQQGEIYLCQHIRSDRLVAKKADTATDGMLPNLKAADRSRLLTKKQIYSFHLTQVPKKLVGIITGDLQNIKEVDVWVNFENTYMEMARPFEGSISGIIRYMGAKKDRTDTIREDTIADELSEVVAGRSVPPGVVIYTGAGELAKTNNVKRILHAASLVGMAGMGYSPIERIEDCIRNSLKVLDGPKKLANEKLTSILFPLMGAVQSQQNAENVASDLINEAIAYLEENPSSIVEKVYFLATREQELDLCQRIMKINDRLHPQES
jgi:hypothetical protein